MGIGICCKNIIKEETNEMKDGVIPSLEDKEVENIKDLKLSSYNINQNYNKKETIDFEFINKDQQKNEEIFLYFNNLRNNPKNYLSEAQKYNLYQLIYSFAQKNKEGNIKNLIKNPFFDLLFDKCVKLSPNSKENILKKLEKEKLFNNYEKKLYIIEGNKEKAEECVWNLIKICSEEGEDILSKNLDYLVISIISLEDDNNSFLCYFLFLSKNQI